jgi:JmjC domain
VPVISPQYAFDRVIAPVPVERFLAEYHERQTLVLHRQHPEYYSDLVSVAVLDEFLSVRPPHRDRVFAVDARRKISPEEYLLPDDRVDVIRLYQLFSEGATISFGQMHDRVPALAALCRAAEQVFDCPFQANLYFTPPNARGFKLHHDTHDVFVLQISGSKRWRVYDPVIRLPLVDQELDAEQPPGPAVEEFTLQAGDLFYCPRGFPHDADATEEPSLHVTFGALAYTWAEVMIEAMADRCLNDPDFRAALPVGFATDRADPDALESQFRSLVDKFRHTARLRPALDGIAEKFVGTRRALVPQQRDQAIGLDAVTVETEVGGRPGLIYRWCVEEEHAKLHCHTREISFPRRTMNAVTYALETPRFCVRDLPDELDDPGKLVLIRRLMREGLVIAIHAEPIQTHRSR